VARISMETNDLVKIYSNNFKALNDISLKVDEGETFALVGLIELGRQL